MADILTPPVISRLPLGLLQFLGIQSGGLYPQSLGNQLVPTFEELDILSSVHSQEKFDVAIPITGIGFAPSPIAVPLNEVWYMHYCTGILFTDATEAVDAILGINGPTGGPHTLPVNFTFSMAASLQRSHGISGPVWVPPGMSIGFIINQITGAPLAGNGQIRLRNIAFRF